MVKVVKELEFEIPENCRKCPVHYSERDGNYTMDFCRLLDYNKTIRITEDKRDDKCPLIDEHTYTI